MVYAKKNVKNDIIMKKNLEDRKKSAIFVPEFITQWSYKIIKERSNDVPTPELVPNEAVSILELLQRSERGQRLNVHQRMRTEDCPDNMYSEADLAKFANGQYDLTNKDERIRESERVRMYMDAGEQFSNTPPGDINDIVDVMRFQEEQEQRKQALKERKKKTVANAVTKAKEEEQKDGAETPNEVK